ncbi:MAG TPA: PTS sugar transporter subunit IIA [Pseudonocardiaceae bacterium]|nr:PTS sugar transporter subunit IIA [Pseudonocardiaceae bacterium]
MAGEAGGVLTAGGVRLGLTATDKHDVIAQCGRVLLELGAVAEPYLPAMHEREASVSTYVGEEVAIPHGTDEARRHVLRTSIAVLQFPDGVDWDGNRVRLAIPIAADGNQHVTLLSSLATILLTPGRAEELRTATDVDVVLRLLHSTDEEISA